MSSKKKQPHSALYKAKVALDASELALCELSLLLCLGVYLVLTWGMLIQFSR